MIERRKYPRLKSHLIVGFRRMDSLELESVKVTEDIGAGGFRIEMDYPGPSFVLGQLMEITIRDPREGAEPVSGFGRIIWMREKEDRSGCEVGVMLTYIKAQDRERYLKYFIEVSPAS